MRGSITVTLATMLWCGAANAAWLHTNQEDPFQGDSHLAMAIDPESGYGAGFRCVVGKDAELTLIFGTPERLSDESLKLVGAVPMKLMVIVDDQPKVELEATGDSVGESNLLRIQSTDASVAGLVKAAMAANRRFAVAVDMMGKVVHSHTFDVRGSKRAIGEMVAGCKLP